MNLLKIVKTEKFKEIVKVTGSAIVGIGLGYASDKSGLTSWLWESKNMINTAIFGEGFYEFLYNYGGRVLNDAVIGIAGATFTYLGLSKLIK